MNIFNLLKSYWWVILILLVVGAGAMRECPPNCTKNWMAGCECNGAAVIKI